MLGCKKTLKYVVLIAFYKLLRTCVLWEVSTVQVLFRKLRNRFERDEKFSRANVEHLR